MGEQLPAICGVWVVAFFYLLFDVYPTVKSFRATLSTFSFWVFWIVFSLLSTVALGVLKKAAGSAINGLGFPYADVAVILLTVLGAIGILQSFTIKFADYKFIDLGKLVEGFRGQVLADISAVSAAQKKTRALAVADLLVQTFKGRTTDLRNEYAGVMSYVDIVQIGKDLDKLKEQASATGLSFELALARRIAQADVERAEQLVKSHRTSVAP
jgi:hypothetical protein